MANLLQREDLNSSDFSNDFSLAAQGVRVRTGAGSSVAAAIAAAITGAETKVLGTGIANVTGSGTTADPYIVNVPAATGTETKVIGAGIASISGTGASGDPYIVNVPASNGTDTKVTAGSNITVTGTGASGDPYVVSAVGGATGLLAVTHDATMTGDGTTTSPLSVVVASETLAGIVELASTTEAAAGLANSLAVTPAGLAAYVAANVTGAETKVTAGTNTTVTGTGTTADPYVLNVADATDAVKGVVELATTIEAAAGTSSTLAVTPAGLAAYVAAVVTGAETKVTAGTNVTVTGSGTTAAPYVINVATAADTVAGVVQLATASNYPATTNDTDAATPAYVAAAIAAVPDIVTTLAVVGVNYVYTNEAATQTVISPSQFISSDAGNGIGTGTDGRLVVSIPAQLPDDQVLSGDNSGNVSVTLTPVVDPVTGNTNYTILANLKAAATNPSGGTNPLAVGASGWYIALKDCAGNYHALDAQIPTCAEMSAAIAAAAPTGAETKVTAGTNTTVTGTGTTADPYVVSATSVGAVPTNLTTVGLVDLTEQQYLGDNGKIIDEMIYIGQGATKSDGIVIGDKTQQADLDQIIIGQSNSGLMTMIGGYNDASTLTPPFDPAVPSRDFVLGFFNTITEQTQIRDGDPAIFTVGSSNNVGLATVIGARNGFSGSPVGGFIVGNGNVVASAGTDITAYGSQNSNTSTTGAGATFYGIANTSTGGGSAYGSSNTIGRSASVYGDRNNVKRTTPTATTSLGGNAVSYGNNNTVQGNLITLAAGPIQLPGVFAYGQYNTINADGAGQNVFSFAYGSNNNITSTYAATTTTTQRGGGNAYGHFNTVTHRTAYVFGDNGVSSANNQILLGGALNAVNFTGTAEVRTSAPIFAAAFNIASDARLKRDVADLDLQHAEAFLKQLKFKGYMKTHNLDLANKQHQIEIENAVAKADQETNPEEKNRLLEAVEHLKQNAPTLTDMRREVGLIAQEVRAIAEPFGFGWLVHEDNDGYLSVDYDSIQNMATAVLISKL